LRTQKSLTRVTAASKLKRKKILILGRKARTNVDRILKTITLPKKACIVKLWFFQYTMKETHYTEADTQ